MGHAQAVVTRDDGPPVEQQIVADMIRRALPVAPVLMIVMGAIWGWNGVLSSGYAIVLVLLNFLLAASMLSWTARISFGLLLAAALFGYLIRLGLIFGAVFVVRNMSWVDVWPLGLTIIVTHLGLLFWETRYVSASLAFPGLKPHKE